MSAVHAIASRAYRTLVLLYPPEFRREFGDEMTRDFAQATREAAPGGPAHVCGLWGRLSVDFIRSLVLQWTRTRLPIVLVIAATASCGGLGLVARLLAGTPWSANPPSSMDADLLALVLMVIVVLMIIVATICVTLFITRPLLYRKRL